MKHLLLVLLLFPFLLTAQTIDLDHLDGLKPRNIGPAGMSGRVTSIDVDLSNEDIIYAGTASGGVWKSTDGGTSWNPIFDEQPIQNIGSVAVSQKNPDVVWVGTGEGNPRNSMSSGGGIYKSLDGGQTWQFKGLKDTKQIHRLVIHPDDPNTVYVGAMGSVWGPGSARGVYKTTDGGDNWERVLYVNDTTGVADLIVDPTNPDKLIAAMWQYGRQPWTFNSGGPGSGLYVTLDGGKTWTERTAANGLPKGDLGRIGLAMATNKPDIVYALVEAKKNALYKSTDGGRKWKKVADKNIGNRPFYYADIYVDPRNENRIFNLFSLVSKSEDGGKSFETLLNYGGYNGVHPDHHAFWISPTDPDYLINGNDGGLNISRDGGEHWRFVENLPLAQFYHINYDMETPYNVYGGMQDNGSWVGPAYQWKRGGIRNGDWQELYFGDGFDVVPRPGNARYGYAMSQGGNVGYYDRETGKTQFVQPLHPEGVPLRFSWNAAIAQDPNIACGVYFGSQFVHYSSDCGQNWKIISPDLTTNDTLKQQQSTSGGLTIDDTQAENHTTILAITPSPVDKQVIWVGTDDGMLQVTRDGGATWKNTSGGLSGVRPNAWIPQIVASEKNAGEAWAVVNDYRRNDYTPYAYHTTNYGSTWQRIAGPDQIDAFVTSIAPDPVEPNLVFLGTDQGLYVSFDGAKNWQRWKKNFPAVQVSDLKIHPREHDLIIGTFGRAAWILDDIEPLREIARSNGKALEPGLHLFDPPNSYLAQYRSYDGVRFVADAIFQGENRRSGAAMMVYWKPAEKAAEKKAVAPTGKVARKGKKSAEVVMKTEEEKPAANNKNEGPKDKAVVHIFDGADTIRTFHTKIDTGMNRIAWRHDTDGLRFPSRTQPKKDTAPRGGGLRVAPGTYKVLVTYNDLRDSSELTVLADPRLDVSAATRQVDRTAYVELTKIVKPATTAFDRIQQSKKTVKLVNTTLGNLPDSTQAKLKDHGKAMLDSLAALDRLYMLPADTEGYQRDPSTLQTSLYSASRHVGASEGANNGTARVAMRRAKAHTQRVLDRINAFYAAEWPAYQAAVEGAKTSLFDAVKPIRIE